MSRMAYGTSVKTRLKRLGYTQADLAKALYFTQSYISKIIGGTPPSPGVRSAIEHQLKAWEDEKKEARYDTKRS